MTHLARSLLSAALLTTLVACSPGAQKATPAEADAFVDRLDAEFRTLLLEGGKAQWLAATYIHPDSQALASAADEKALAFLAKAVEESKRFDGLELSPATARKLMLLRLSTENPAPKDPAELAELTRLKAGMEAAYGAGKYCKDAGDPASCRSLGDLSKILAAPGEHTYEQLLEAWTGWHSIAKPMRSDYQRFVELMNAGATDLGYPDVGTLWRSAYDMPADDFYAETDRLWGQVKPLYDDLHCYVRSELHEKWGDKVPADGPIPAHLLGNMWAQEWGYLYDMVQPYPKAAGDLDVDSGLRARRAAEEARLIAASKDRSPKALAEIAVRADDFIAREMVKSAEAFYVSLGMPELPESFWERSQFIKPRDRDVVCHASAWDMDTKGDVRIKMCITPTHEDLTTIYHELGHLYYDLAYNPQPIQFQAGAHAGFHEAIGDTVQLAMTPQYLAQVGLIKGTASSEQALINEQMKNALDKVAFLPWAKLVDQWRWDVFSGKTAPADYNKAWWELREKYQGVAAPVARTEEDFDPGAKFHVPANVSYTRYFLARIMQYQFYRSLCEASGHQGPLHTCSFFGSKEAGDRFWAMLQQGASQPWPDTLEKLTGTREMDASAMVEYFQPLQGWLKEQNKNSKCGW